MHQTFYVDADEEVNSVIGRLRKSTSQYNILVVAQQALILQSSVSLRLIKREMDALKKRVMVVTQDEYGLAVAKKAGFAVKKTIDDIKKNQSSVNTSSSDDLKNDIVIDSKAENEKNEAAFSKHNRLKNLGDDSFRAMDEMALQKPIKENDKKEKDHKKKIGFEFNQKEKENFDNLFVEKSDDMDSERQSKNVAKNAGRFLWIFSAVSAVLLVGIFVYLFIPRADIKVIPQRVQKNINLTVYAGEKNQEGEFMSDMIKLGSTLVEEEDVFSLDFETTGQKNSANKKARGIITIYNDFSEASQILVATTRFLSEDGKVFRLIKNETVPGIKVENEGKAAGEVKVEVIADQPGEEYNIDPTSFKIPGFEGGPKYDKFSAKSEEKMKGGGEGESDLRAVSEADVENAKKEVLEKIKAQLAKKVEEKTKKENNVFSEEFIEYEIIDSASFPEIGSVANNFEYQIKVKARCLTFSEEKLNEKINEYVNNNIVSKQDFSAKIAKIDKKYGESSMDFSNDSIETKLSVDILLEADIDYDSVKKELIGKNQEEIDEIISSYPEIKKIDAAISPSFFASQIPRYQSRVDLEVGSE